MILSLRFNGHFPDGPGLAVTRISPFWILLELRMMEVVVSTGTMRRVPVKSSSPTNQHPVFTGRTTFLSPNQQCQSTKGMTEGHLDLQRPSGVTY